LFLSREPKPQISGRKKGIDNESIFEIREAIHKVMSEKIEKLEDDLKLMTCFQ
jgi:hypothetical protein